MRKNQNSDKFLVPNNSKKMNYSNFSESIPTENSFKPNSKLQTSQANLAHFQQTQTSKQPLHNTN